MEQWLSLVNEVTSNVYRQQAALVLSISLSMPNNRSTHVRSQNAALDIGAKRDNTNFYQNCHT